TAAVRHPLGGAARAGALARRARRGPRRYRRGARGRGGPVGPRPRRRPPAAAHPRLAAERGPPLPADLRGLLRHVPRRGPARRAGAGDAGEADLPALDGAAVSPQPRIRVSPQSGDHLSRLISAASYVMSRDEVQLAERSEALGVSEKQLITDLQVLFVCGDM